MARRRRKRRLAGFPDLTSFSDIAFLLIIYFILATSLHQVAGLRTDMPAGQKARQAKAEQKAITLHVDGILWGRQEVSVRQLREELVRLELPARDPNDRVVQFEAKGGVSWQQYYDVLAAIEHAGGTPGIVTDAGGSR